MAGCRFGTLPDPNDPREVGLMQAQVIRNRLKGLSDMLNARQAKGEITDLQTKEIIARHAQELVDTIDLNKVPASQAWEYGDIFLTAKQWPTAERILRVAVQKAPSEDRRVNDTLRMAWAQAEQGKVKESIATARQVFDTDDANAGPILPAVLLQIVPAARGKGHDIQLGKLLEDAIAQHERVIVKPDTQAGLDFLLAKPFHIRDAWQRAAQLYQGAGAEELARRAASKSIEAQSNNMRL